MLLMEATAPVALVLLDEDRLVEQLTFVALFGAGLIAALMAWLHRRGFQWWVRWVYVLLALACLVVAMEEVSWGQRRLGIETPISLRRFNRQGEITLHNIGSLQGHSEWMRLCAGIGGLLALGARRIPALQSFAAPPVLKPWFVIITGHAAIDVFDDIIPITPRFTFIMQQTSEMLELLIGLAAFLYVSLNAQSAAAFQKYFRRARE